MTPGTRVRLNSKCPWPERIGAAGVIVAPRSDGVYPQPPRSQALVLLDDDPLGRRNTWWTCAILRTALDPLESTP